MVMAVGVAMGVAVGVAVGVTYGPKAAGQKKVPQMSLNSPHSKSPPGQTVGPSNLSFWIPGEFS